MVKKSVIQEWVKERNEVVASMDIEAFKRFYRKYQEKGIYSKFEPIPNDNVLEIVLRKMAVECNGVPEEVKQEARAWLISRGYRAGL